MQAVETVYRDKGYTLPSQRALDAAKCAKTVTEWIMENKETEVLVKFCDNLVSKLKHCLPSTTGKFTKQHRIKMWRNLFQLQTSSNFNEAWEEFLKTIEAEGDKLFYEHVTDEAVKILIKKWQFESTALSIEEEYSVENLTYEENNALRYAAGVIPRNLMKKLKNSNRSNKKYLLMYLEELLVNPDEDISSDGSTDWINQIDRGGLLHVNEMMFKILQCMEVEFRYHLDKENIKDSAISGICKNEDVLFYWELLSGRRTRLSAKADC